MGNEAFEKSFRPNIEPHWRGFGVPENDLPRFLYKVSTEIDVAWETEYSRAESGFLRIDAHRRVASDYGIGSLARNVIREAFYWYASADPDKKRVGGNILGYYMLAPVLHAVDRIKRHYPEANLNEDELLERGLLAGIELIDSAIKPNGEVDTKLISSHLAGVFNNKAFYEGESLVAENVRLPVDWVKKGLHKDILTFREDFAKAHDRYPDISEVLKHFNLRDDDVNNQIVSYFIFGDKIEEPEDPETRVIEQDLKERIRALLGTLTPRESRILDLRFGLSTGGKGKTFKEVGNELEEKISGPRAQQILSNALRKLRKNPRSKFILEGYY